MSLVDHKILSLIDRLKQKNIKVIALTAIPTGKFGLISNTEEWRVKQLATHGISLNWSFPKIDTFELEGFTGKTSLPVFKQGVLASAKYPKGQVLCAFLKKIDLKPSRILFIDDRMQFIDSVECELEKAGIPHTSFHYTAAIDRPCHLDQRLANFQLNHLMQYGEWLNDETAKSKMEQSAEVQVNAKGQRREETQTELFYAKNSQ